MGRGQGGGRGRAVAVVGTRDAVPARGLRPAFVRSPAADAGGLRPRDGRLRKMTKRIEQNVIFV